MPRDNRCMYISMLLACDTLIKKETAIKLKYFILHEYLRPFLELKIKGAKGLNNVSYPDLLIMVYMYMYICPTLLKNRL